MARKRDYAAEYARRQARARELGYENYYGRRVRAGAPPSAPAPRGEALARARGHRSSADLEALLRAGRVERVTTVTSIDRRGRDETTVIADLDDGRTVEFTLRGPQVDRIAGVIDDMGTDAPQVSGSPKGRKRLGEDDEDELDDDEGSGFDESPDPDELFGLPDAA